MGKYTVMEIRSQWWVRMEMRKYARHLCHSANVKASFSCPWWHHLRLKIVSDNFPCCLKTNQKLTSPHLHHILRLINELSGPDATFVFTFLNDGNKEIVSVSTSWAREQYLALQLDSLVLVCHTQPCSDLGLSSTATEDNGRQKLPACQVYPKLGSIRKACTDSFYNKNTLTPK